MTAKQFTSALERLELSHYAAAQVLGIGRRSIVRYAAGHSEVPTVVERLIELLLKHGIPKEYAA